jgi:hypothetical protein
MLPNVLGSPASAKLCPADVPVTIARARMSNVCPW